MVWVPCHLKNDPHSGLIPFSDFEAMPLRLDRWKGAELGSFFGVSDPSKSFISDALSTTSDVLQIGFVSQKCLFRHRHPRRGRKVGTAICHHRACPGIFPSRYFAGKSQSQGNGCQGNAEKRFQKYSPDNHSLDISPLFSSQRQEEEKALDRRRGRRRTGRGFGQD